MPDSPLHGTKLILGVTGSIAAYKAAELVRLLVRAGAEVQPVLTEGATHFIAPLTIGTLARREVLVEVFPENAAGSWTKHVDLGLWADGLVVAPCSANTLAKLAAGTCDSMLTAIYLSARCPVLVAPAMDHDMWRHPATRRNAETLRADGVTVLDPAHGELASGLVGEGRLPEPEALVAALAVWMEGKGGTERRKGRAEGPPPDSRPPTSDLLGKKVLVTAGPTREALDPVRFLSNGSTGTMGFALAGAAARRGAEVVLLAGPVTLPTPEGVTRVDVVSADDLLAAALAHADADLVIAAAAVADYAPAEASHRKTKKTEGDLTLHLRRTPDVLARLGAQKRDGQTLVGFALETHDGEANARAKLTKKHLDWIVLNAAGEPGSGFGTGTNRVTLLGANDEREDLPRMPKREVAEALLDRIVEHLP